MISSFQPKRDHLTFFYITFFELTSFSIFPYIVGFISIIYFSLSLSLDIYIYLYIYIKSYR